LRNPETYETLVNSVISAYDLYSNVFGGQERANGQVVHPAARWMVDNFGEMMMN
jgi:hypothetical protein